MRFALAGGGTGGHAYPAIAVAEELRRSSGDVDLVYYGTAHGPEHALATAADIPYRVTPASQVRGRSPLRLLGGTWNLLRGSRVASAYLEQDAPAALFATGGYAAAPIGRAAGKRGIPLVVFLPDVRPGWAVRFLARYATRIACTVEGSLEYLPSPKAVVTGYPLRGQFSEATREEGLRRFQLDPALRTVLIAGGSLGAHQINLVVSKALRTLLERAQVLHICGPGEEHWLRRERERLPDWLRTRYHLYAYTEDMAWAMAAADLAVMRAGASTLGELPASGLPAIVIPGEFSDQHDNARFLEERGAAMVLSTREIDDLEDTITMVLDNEERRAAMAAAMRALARPHAAERLASLLREVAA